MRSAEIGKINQRMLQTFRPLKTITLLLFILLSVYINACYSIIDQDKLKINHPPRNESRTADKSAEILDTIYNADLTSMIEDNPDLIISSIFSKVKLINTTYIPGKPQRYSPPIPSYEYTITVRNIGKVAAARPFYIVWTRDIPGITKENYSNYILVNRESGIISSGGSIEVNLTFGDNKGRKFLVNPRNIDYYPFIPESNYDNNVCFY